MAQNIEIINSNGGDWEDETVKKSQFKNLNKVTDYSIPNAKQVFIQLRQALIKTPILQYYDPKCHIQIETNTSNYVFRNILS